MEATLNIELNAGDAEFCNNPPERWLLVISFEPDGCATTYDCQKLRHVEMSLVYSIGPHWLFDLVSLGFCLH